MPPRLQFLATKQKACGGNYICEAVYQNCLCPFFKGRENSLERKSTREKIIRSETAAGVNLRAHPIVMKWAARKIRKSDMVVLQIKYICFFKSWFCHCFLFYSGQFIHNNIVS